MRRLRIGYVALLLVLVLQPDPAMGQSQRLSLLRQVSDTSLTGVTRTWDLDAHGRVVAIHTTVSRHATDRVADRSQVYFCGWSPNAFGHRDTRDADNHLQVQGPWLQVQRQGELRRLACGWMVGYRPARRGTYEGRPPLVRSEGEWRGEGELRDGDSTPIVGKPREGGTVGIRPAGDVRSSARAGLSVTGTRDRRCGRR